MEFLSFLKIGAALSASLIIGLLLTAYALVCFIMTVGSIFFWDTNDSFVNQQWAQRAIWLILVLPFALALFLYAVPHIKDFIHFIWSLV